jgi:nitroimidazol reductase NimA-like FMN-containing flavoprotein (pyridoxamine 5'-phosphate oxidase superfamily)
MGMAMGKYISTPVARGLKMEILQANPNVCFEVDESISDCSLAKSVIIFGRAEIIAAKKEMIPYLEKLIDKYRVPVTFGEYMRKGNRDVQEELEQVRIGLITPYKITGHKFVRKNGNF